MNSYLVVTWCIIDTFLVLTGMAATIAAWRLAGEIRHLRDEMRKPGEK
jgi:hypothetical protein